MLFSIGNLITIFIVLIILALYRQLDKNNRSLDKVRRYSDKVTGEIDSFVDQKTQDMKNLAIEIDVHQKTGKEVLKRIAAIEENFSTKAGEVDEINARIAEYDKALNELAGMTGKVDENLKRLHQESEFVDKVGKRLKDVQTRMAGLEKDIPRISEQFSAENEKEFEKLRIELFSEVERQSALVLDGISQGKERVDEFTSHLDDLESRRDEAAASALKEINMKADSAIESADDQIRSLSMDFKAGLDEILAASENRRSELAGKLDSSEAAFRSHIEEIGDLLSNKLVVFKDSINSFEEDYQKNLKESAEKARLMEDDVFASLKSYIDERSKDTRKQVNNVFEELKKSSLAYRSEIDSSFGESQSGITVWRTKLQKELDESQDDIRNRAEALIPRTEQMLAGIDAESRRLVDETKEVVNKRLDNMISTVNDKESHLSEFEENLAYKLTRIEEITSDIDLLEDNLKKMVDKAVNNVNSGFEDIRDEMSQKWQQSRSSLQTDIESAREVMAELEKELDALKASAYENVSAKLKDFEDGFFDDLKDKSGRMEEQLSEWQKSVDFRLEQLSADTEAERAEIEKNYSAELNTRMMGLMDKTSAEFSDYESQVESYKGVLQRKLDGINTSVDGIKDKFAAELQETSSALETFIAEELDRNKKSVEVEISRFMKEAEANLHETEEVLKSDKENILRTIEAQRSELEIWQARIAQQISDTENGVQEQYTRLKTDSSERVAEIREMLASQREDFDGLSSDIFRRSRELKNELDQQIKDFDEKAEEISENFNLSAKRVYEKIEEQSRELTFNLNEIESRQKEFVAQTKIFERADSMKESLESDVAELQSEINRVSSRAAEIHEAEKKFNEVKKLSEEISSKLMQFNAERRKIDELDNDFQRLMSISQSVESKLDQVTSADDSLQLVQARLKELDGLQKEVEGNYERLQKKSAIVESTISGVDRSFEQLNELDHMISVVSEKSMPLSSRLDELTRRIDFLSKNKKQIDTAIGHIETMDSTLEDLEDRIERMQKAREWLAGTETRLEEVNKQAQEQVRLLGTLVKGSESKARGSGAPPHEIRDVVIKLAHQGWTVEQIAKSTQLARGEVELILELQPKK